MITLIAPNSHKVGRIPILYINLNIEDATRKRMPALPGIVNTDANETNIIAHIIADKRESSSANKINYFSIGFLFRIQTDCKPVCAGKG